MLYVCANFMGTSQSVIYTGQGVNVEEACRDLERTLVHNVREGSFVTLACEDMKRMIISPRCISRVAVASIRNGKEYSVQLQRKGILIEASVKI